jgi:hypothetical protein
VKKLLTTVLLLSCTTVEAASERSCLIFGERAALYAKYTGKVSEEDIVTTINDSHTQAKAVAKTKRQSDTADTTQRLERAILSYVVTMQLDAADARKLVYLKCKGGEYDHMDTSR